MSLRLPLTIQTLQHSRLFHDDKHNQEGEASKFEDNQHMKVVSLSALRTGRLYPPGKFPVTLFC